MALRIGFPHVKAIRTKFIISLLLFSPVLAVFGYVAISATHQLATEFNKTVDSNVPRIVALSQIKSTGLEIHADLDHLAAGRLQGETDSTTNIRDSLLAAIDELQTAKTDFTSHNKGRSQTISASVDPIIVQASDLVSLYGQNAPESETGPRQEKLEQSISALQVKVDQTIDTELYLLNKSDISLDHTVAATSKRIYVLTVLALVCGLVIVVVMTRVILAPIARLKRGVALLSRGELKERIQVGSKDEIGQLADAFNDMAQKLQDSRQALEQEKAGVEQKVIERTGELHEEQAKLRASIEGLVLGFVLIDRNDKIVIQNNMLQTIFGTSEPFASMQQLEEKLHDFDLSAARQTILETGQAVAAKEASLDSKILNLQLSPVKVVENGQASVIGMVILVEDITEAKVMARSKDEFFSIASHELRTPLTAIMGNASMIIDYHPEVLKDNDMKQMVFDIHDASERLIGIVGDFMDVSGLEQGKVVFKPEEFTLGSVVENVAYEMRTILEQKHLSLQIEPKTLDTLPAVWADKARTKQVIYNLVGNALKYTEEGGASVKISEAGGAMKIEVSDTGRGISVENQKLLFHKLQQAGDSILTRDTTRGTGLGLYICKILVERMGGTIALESSEPDKGSTFSVTFPLASAAREQSPADDAAHTDTTTGLST